MNDKNTINTIKGLIIDGVNKAKSGHPGGAMSSLDFAYLLFTEYLRFDPKNTNWLGRDRFILSAGHESMLIYSLLFMQGHLTKEDLASFRQLSSRTPGHPENLETPGIECTTGPLGQGAAMSVGFAMAASHFKSKLDDKLFAQRIWSILGDGCIQEDITYGAASLAGHLGLANLIWYYDQNKIQISGKIDRAYSDDTKMVYEGLGWEVIELDGHDHQQLRTALDCATGERKQKPLLIIGKTTMAKGAYSMEGSHATHGAPLPADERTNTKKALGLENEDFYVSKAALNHFQRNFEQKSQEVAEWDERLKECRKNHDFDAYYNHCFVKEDFTRLEPLPWDKSKKIASRVAFGKIIENWAHTLPNLIGGSADLEPSNMTGAFAKKVGDFSKSAPEKRNIAFGVREFPMSAVCNGLALFGGLIPFDATFLTFSDYSRPALRLGALQKARVIHEFTHDSFYLGEDGPTHQPVEHIMSLRMIPNFYVMRPADAIETETMMKAAIGLTTNSAICLSRQGLPFIETRENISAKAIRGAYEITTTDQPEIIIFATGSEVHLAIEVAKRIENQEVKVVSMPCWELFLEQDQEYIEETLAQQVTKRISIEAGSTLGWQKFTGSDGINIGIDCFGASAPGNDLEKEFGFTPEAILSKIKERWG